VAIPERIVSTRHRQIVIGIIEQKKSLDDIMTGNDGNDTFVFRPNFDRAMI